RYAWGTDEVAWTTTQNGKTTNASHTGVFLNVRRQQADGEWKLSHHMWDDAISKRCIVGMTECWAWPPIGHAVVLWLCLSVPLLPREGEFAGRVALLQRG